MIYQGLFVKFLQGNPGNPLPLKNNYHFCFYLILKKQNLALNLL